MPSSTMFRKQVVPGRPVAFGVTPDGMLVSLSIQVTHGAPRVLPQIPYAVVVADYEKLATIECVGPTGGVQYLPVATAKAALEATGAVIISSSALPSLKPLVT